MIEQDTTNKIFQDRKRTNVLRSSEQATISFLVQRIPAFLTPNVLTTIGLLGSFLVLLGFISATYVHKNYLLLCVAGLVVNWFGDSLDGRIAYFRNIPRKWYGFSLDIVTDWVGTVLIGLGYMVYTQGVFELLAFLFVVLYGWAMILSQLRYKITDKYLIDAGLVGPTEIRIIIALVILLELIFPDTLDYYAGAMCAVLLVINLVDTSKLLDMGNERDAVEKASKLGKGNEA